MPGRSVEYVFAFERPIDMIPPIWLCARRCMNQKKPTRITIGSRNGSRLMNQLGLGVVYSTSTSASRMAARSASGMPPSSGPVVRNSSPPASSV